MVDAERLYRPGEKTAKSFEIRNSKWFDQPFDRLTVLSEVEGLTSLGYRPRSRPRSIWQRASPTLFFFDYENEDDDEDKK
jgi:hypothetical protein